METKDFYFDLPNEQIAQHPSGVRGNDKLMLLNKLSGEVKHFEMKDLPDLIESGTVMVFNNTRVRRSRVYALPFAKENAQKPTKEIEFLFLNPLFVSENENGTIWKAMVKNAKRQKIGKKFCFKDGTVAEIFEYDEFEKTEFRAVKFDKVVDESWFEKNGHIPLPPYIKREDIDEDSERYQTIYAKNVGSAAAPTAGLHFTDEIFENLKSKGVEIVYVTLHVGLGTFLPVRTEKIEDHKMHEETFFVSDEAALAIEKAKKEGRKVLAVGTTSLRTLESCFDTETQKLKRGENKTSIFIYPGYKFKVIDQLFTNFHTPESTLLMLVSALAGKDNIMSAYDCAVKNNYRFFSYGDAMFIQ